MVVENEITSFGDWLLFGDGPSHGALVQFGATAGVLALLALAAGYLVLMIRYGPVRAGELTYRTISGGVAELGQISPRRVSALAGLAIKESWRRRVWVGLVVFLMILAFAFWFLTSNHQEPGKLYLSFVMTATTYLMLLLSLLLSTFSLPGDFTSKTIYTIVTKPVRAGDIVLGKMFGFIIVGTAMLSVMGACSYFFVVRALGHTHDVDPSGWEEVKYPDGAVLALRGSTGATQRHTHEVDVDAEGVGVALSHHGHEHAVRLPAGGGATATSGVQNLLRARSPKRGKIYFLDPNGATKAKGVSVGNEWTYRSFIQGGSLAAAVWTFDGVDESLLNENGELPLELFVRVFRTYAGDHERAIQGSIQLRNPDNEDIASNAEPFGANDFAIDDFYFPREQFDKEMNPIDLFDDLVGEGGRLEVVVQCLEGGQYYGFAQADCYIRLPEGSPLWNFVKGYLSIWAQMVVVITIGVTASTFLNGPISMMFTTSFIILGFFRDFLVGIATGVQPDGTKVYGGGPLEALARLPSQMNLTSRFEESTPIDVLLAVDEVLKKGIEYIAYVVPDFRSLSTVRYVAEGFSIPGAMVGRELGIALAYLVGLSIAGYFFLRTREVAK